MGCPTCAPGSDAGGSSTAKSGVNEESAAHLSAVLRVASALKPSPKMFDTVKRLLDEVTPEFASFDLQHLSNASAAFGDGLTHIPFTDTSLTAWVRQKMGTDYVVQKGSKEYGVGEFVGQMYGLALGGAGAVVREGTGAIQVVSHWDSVEKIATMRVAGEDALQAGQWVMTGTAKGLAGVRNWLFAGGPELGYKFGDAVTVVTKGANLTYPIAEEGIVMGTIKGLLGQRVVR